tara:strand:- start:5653 stop:5973 length:321 start_codon:yes stop_codon:yes gene_type:complete
MTSLDEINNSIMEQNTITTNWNYRNYLIRNGKQIINHNKLNACLNRGIINEPLLDENKNTPPHLFTSVTDTGTPFGYQTSDLKEAFVFKRQNETRKVVPRIIQEKL